MYLQITLWHNPCGLVSLQQIKRYLMPKLWKKTSPAQGNNQLQEIDLPTLAIAAPTVIFISGHVTRDDNPKFTAKGLDFMERIFQGQPEFPALPQIYSWSHGSSLKTLFNAVAYDSRPGHAYSSTAKQLAEGTIMPLVSANGRPLPFAEAQKKLRNLTFLGYSAGNVVAQEVFNASLKMMKDIGYKPEEARKLLHEVVLINIGTISRPSKEQDRFTTIYLANSDDRFVRGKNLLLHPLRSVFSKGDRQLTIEQLSETSLLVSAAASRKMRDKHEVSKEKELEGVKLPHWNYSVSNHDIYSYINNDDKRSQMSRIVSHALINALGRKTTLKPLQLLEPTAAIDSQEKSLYLNRIAKAQGIKK